MKHSKKLILSCIVATVGLTGCPSDDDPVTPTLGPAEAKAAIESVLDSVVDPLVLAMEVLTDYLDTLSGSSTRATCPDTSTACSPPGTLSCSPTTLGWDFTFSGCTVVGSSSGVTLNGGAGVRVTSPTSFTLALTGLSVDGGAVLNGEIAFSDSCDSTWNIYANNATVTGRIIACSEENPQSGSHLLIQVSGTADWIIDIDFDGTSVATADVFSGVALIASCSIDLVASEATCSSPGP